MKRLIAVLFADEAAFVQYSNRVCERFSDLPEEKEFCGIWGEISFNKDEVLAAISDAVNHFIKDTDKIEIVFGCCIKDYKDILSKIHTENCAVEQISCQNV